IEVLEAASEFNVQDTLPDLQHEFCALWNQIVLKAQNDHDWRMAAIYILRPIRNVYIALHEGTASAPTQFSTSTDDGDDVLFDPTSYPQCDVVSHIHDVAFTTLARTVLHDNDASLLAPVVGPDVPSSSDVPAPPHVVKNLTGMPVLDDFHPRTAHQTTTESLPVTSTDTATADASGIILPCPTSSTLTPVPPLSSTSPPAAVTLKHNADLPVPSGQPNHPSSASHPILDNSDSTEYHRLAIVPVTPSASTGPASAPDLGAAAKDDDSSTPGPRKDRGVHSDPPSAIRAIHASAMVTLDLPPPSPLSVTDVDPTIAGSSLREPNADRTGDLPLDPLHCPAYDIV
ncbi:hypothetical protein EDB83DRAFT_2437292, partial [Lactarius deliciosus]